MKSPAAYYLLLVYLFALCRPVMPLLQDMAAHTFSEHQHLATAHRHGCSHVQEEVGKMAEDASENSSSAALKTFDAIPLHLITTTEFHSLLTPSIVLFHSNYYSSRLSAIPLAIQLPPPRC